ncbi:MAG: hypothetical protein ACK5NY_10845 [Burkholderiaceae bacterium]
MNCAVGEKGGIEPAVQLLILMPRIQPIHLAAAQLRVEPMSAKQAEAFADAVYASQPNLLVSLLVLPRYGVTYQELDIVLKILFICFEAVRETGVTIPTITEEDQERCLARVTGRARFLEGLDEQSSKQAVADQVRYHPEPNLLAVAYGILAKHDLVSARTEAQKYLLLAVINLVEVLSDALNHA